MSDIDPKLSRLYREASAEGPPAALDAAILAAARRQAAQPRRPARSSWVRWMAPASALATLVVAVSLAFLMERERPAAIDETVIREMSPRPQSPAPASAAGAVRPAAPASAASEKKQAPQPDARQAPRGDTRMDAPAAAAAAPVPGVLMKDAARPAPAPVPDAPAQSPSPRSAEPAPGAAQAFPAERREKSESKMIAPKAATESNEVRGSALGAAGTAAPAIAPAAPAAAGRAAPLRQQAAPRSPEAWLEEIGRLRREGRDQEAAEQLAEFRRAYPAYAVPQHLFK